MWCGGVWCGVVWCGVVWCGVVWGGVVGWFGRIVCWYHYIAASNVVISNYRHSTTRQVLVALASDLKLDTFLPSSLYDKGEQGQNWNWFHKYCLATRTATCLQNRVQELPKDFRDEVARKVAEVEGEDEPFIEELEREKEDGGVKVAIGEDVGGGGGAFGSGVDGGVLGGEGAPKQLCCGGVKRDAEKCSEERESLQAAATEIVKPYESHHLFTVPHDHQLLNWIKK